MDTCAVCKQRFNVGMSLNRGLTCIQCLQETEDLSDAEQLPVSDFINSFGYYFRREPAAKLARRLRRSFLAFLLAPAGIVLLVELLIFLVGFLNTIAFVALPDSLQVTLVKAIQALGSLTLLLALFILGLRWLGRINNALVALNYPHVVLHVLLSFFVPPYGVVQTVLLSRGLDRVGENSVTYGRLCIV